MVWMRERGGGERYSSDVGGGITPLVYNPNGQLLRMTLELSSSATVVITNDVNRPTIRVSISEAGSGHGGDESDLGEGSLATTLVAAIPHCHASA